MAQTVCPDGKLSDPEGNCAGIGLPMKAGFPTAASLGIANPAPSRYAVANITAPSGTTEMPTTASTDPVALAAITARQRTEEKEREAAELRARAQDAAAKDSQPTTVPRPHGADPNAIAEAQRTEAGSVERIRAELAARTPRKAYDTLIGPQNQIMVVQPDRAQFYLGHGWRYRQSGEDTFAGIRAEAKTPPADSVTGAGRGPGGTGTAFIAPSSLPPPTPVSAQIAALPGYRGNAPERGSWTFRGGYPETGKPGAREGTGVLSRAEQSAAWNEFLDRRSDEERGHEVAMAKASADIAGAEQAVKAAALDPLEMARIRAEGQYGGEAIKARADLAARQQALAQAVGIYRQALATQDPQQRRQLMEIAAALANIMLGQRVTQNPQDMLSMLIGQGLVGGAGLGGAVAAGAPPPTK